MHNKTKRTPNFRLGIAAMNSSLAQVVITEHKASPTAAPITLATIRGEIDLSNAEEISVQLNDASQQRIDMIVDLSAVTYIDSQGARILQHLANRHSYGALRLTLLAPPNSVARKLLSITAIDQAVPVIDSLDVAVHKEQLE
jgi:anti-anti-sigma factor